jgi:ubiquinone/menaquinone biosynthesis C-methylase UbiE
LYLPCRPNGGASGAGCGSRDHGHCRWGPREGAFDPRVVLEQIGVAEGDVFLDAGCGEGRFAIRAASMVGAAGKVYAADTSAERIAALERLARERGLDQIEAFVADVTEQIPAPADTADVCLIANVLHGLVDNGAVRGELREIKRVLRPEGTLAILDFRKDLDRPPGPPVSLRLDPLQTESLLSRYGFQQQSSAEAGRYHYLSVFKLVE